VALLVLIQIGWDTRYVPSHGYDEYWRGLLCETKAALPEANEAPLSDHEMIDGLNIQQLACGDDFARHQHILNIYMENLCVLFGSF
jgi:hypothetical protein